LFKTEGKSRKAMNFSFPIHQENIVEMWKFFKGNFVLNVFLVKGKFSMIFHIHCFNILMFSRMFFRRGIFVVFQTSRGVEKYVSMRLFLHSILICKKFNGNFMGFLNLFIRIVLG
jgi:hypothetical protein